MIPNTDKNIYFVSLQYARGIFPEGHSVQTSHRACYTYSELLENVYSDPDVLGCQVASIKRPDGQWIVKPNTPGDYDIQAGQS